ncbi:hypothetical protein B7767_38095, partial [Streptomyces sp. 13-12-16]
MRWGLGLLSPLSLAGAVGRKGRGHGRDGAAGPPAHDDDLRAMAYRPMGPARDPAGGLVRTPCAGRNGMAAGTATRRVTRGGPAA